MNELPIAPHMLLPLAAGVVLLLALIALWFSGMLEKRTGLSSDAKIIASDTSQNRVEKIWDKKTGLVGQPDYVLKERVGLLRRWKLVPVELKPTRRGRSLYHSDRMQLVVYMLLMRAKYGRQFAGYGKVRYKKDTFTVKLTPALERECLGYARDVRAVRQAEDVARSHNKKGRCGACGLRQVCDASLA